MDGVVEKLMLSLDVHDRLEVLWRGLEDQPGIERQGQVLIIQVVTAGFGFSLGRGTHVHARVTVAAVLTPAFTRCSETQPKKKPKKPKKTRRSQSWK